MSILMLFTSCAKAFVLYIFVLIGSDEVKRSKDHHIIQ